MEISRQDASISLDLLKASAAEVNNLEVGHQAREDRPWQALERALHYGIQQCLKERNEHAGITQPDEITEALIRQRLIEYYLHPPNKEAVIKAKLEDDSSFFSLCEYETAKMVEEHWEWYLYCLTFEEKLFDSLSEVTKKEECFQPGGRIRRTLNSDHRDPITKSFQLTFLVNFRSARPGLVLFEIANSRTPVFQLCMCDEQPCNQLVVKVRTQTGMNRNCQKEIQFEEYPNVKISEGGCIHQAKMTVEDAKAKVRVLKGCRGFCYKKPKDSMKLVMSVTDRLYVKGECSHTGTSLFTTELSRDATTEDICYMITNDPNIMPEDRWTECRLKISGTEPGLGEISALKHSLNKKVTIERIFPSADILVDVFFKDQFPNNPVLSRDGEWTSYKVQSSEMSEWLRSAPLTMDTQHWYQVSVQKWPLQWTLSVDGAFTNWTPTSANLDPFQCELMTCDCYTIGGSVAVDGAGRECINTSFTKDTGWLAKFTLCIGEGQQLCASYDLDAPQARGSDGSLPLDAVRMPLDRVDLQIIAAAFQAQIEVTHLREESWFFLPPGSATQAAERCCVHLLRHGQLWAPVLGQTNGKDESKTLEGSIVELGDLNGLFNTASHTSAVVTSYDAHLDAYLVCNGQVNFPVSRKQIKRILYQPKGGNDEGVTEDDLGPEALRQIPDGSIWFQILHELVREIAGRRLHEKHLQLKGVVIGGASTSSYPTQLGIDPPRANRTSGPHAEQGSEDSGGCREVGAQGLKPASSSQAPVRGRTSITSQASRQPAANSQMAEGAPVTSATSSSSSPSSSSHWLRIDDAKQRLRENCKLSVGVFGSWTPTGQGQLKIREGEDRKVYVQDIQEPWVLCHFQKQEAEMGWCPLHCVTYGQVKSPYVPSAGWNDSLKSMCLPLQTDMMVKVTGHLGDGWEGWCVGHPKDGQAEQRIFPHSHIQEGFWDFAIS